MPKPYLAIVGGQSLLGREARTLLSDSNFPAQVKLIGADPEETGAITEQDGEPVVVSPLDQDNLTGASLVFLAGSAASSRRAFDLISRTTPAPVAVDLSYGLEDSPQARLRAPLVEPAGLDELRLQTVNLFSLKKLPTEVFDAQLSFNLLAHYGEEAPQSLEEVELRIERHLASLLALHGGVPLPSLRLIQAPVFHGYGISVWVEFESNPGVAAIEGSLAAAGIDVRTADLEPPTNVGMTGQTGIAVGAIAADRNQPRAAWFWVAADNFTLTAQNAVAVAREFM